MTPTHLFVVWPNNAGSSLVEQLLAGSNDTVGLGIEGQFVAGFDDLGPVPLKLGAAMLFTERADVLADPAAYDWRAITQLWNELWSTRSNRADQVRVEKSPPNVCRVELLLEHFPRAGLVLGWRNPYAQAEGILRARKGNDLERVAAHVLACLRWQRRNIQLVAERSSLHVAFPYETVAGDPTRFAEATSEAFSISVPALEEVTVKFASGPVTDHNQRQIDALRPEQRSALTRIFAEDEPLLDWFGYELL